MKDAKQVYHVSMLQWADSSENPANMLKAVFFCILGQKKKKKVYKQKLHQNWGNFPHTVLGEGYIMHNNFM